MGLSSANGPHAQSTKILTRRVLPGSLALIGDLGKSNAINMNGRHSGNGVVKSARKKEKYKTHPYKIEKNAKLRRKKHLARLSRKAAQMARRGRDTSLISRAIEFFKKKFGF